MLPQPRHCDVGNLTGREREETAQPQDWGWAEPDCLYLVPLGRIRRGHHAATQVIPARGT